MSKRAPQFARRKHDAYDTPAEAVGPLLRQFDAPVRFIEPCAGNGALIQSLETGGLRCVGAYDIEPRPHGLRLLMVRHDATTYQYPGAEVADCFITNPPWSRDLLHPIILNLSTQLPTWLLFDADWMHTRQAAQFMPLCRKIVSVGRVKWIPDSPFTGKDNAAWYLFDAKGAAPAQFVGREAA